MAFHSLDTNIVSFMMNSHHLLTAYQTHLIGFDWAMSFQTAGELLAGWGNTRWAALGATLASMTTLHSDLAVCGAGRRSCRPRPPIAVADCWIAATALAFNLELVTHNPADFANIPGLVVISEAP